MLKPLGGLFQSFLQSDPGPKSELPGRSGSVQSPAGLTVRVGRVPADFALKAGQAGDAFGKILDGNLGARRLPGSRDRSCGIKTFQKTPMAEPA